MKCFYLFFKTFICCVAFIFINEIIQAQTIYVTPNGAGNQSGNSWANAIPGTQFQGAINNAVSGGQVWVAAGTYKPTTGTDRTISFIMKEGVAIYGGFTGTETALNQRPAITFSQPSTSILSGDIGTPGDYGDNTFHIILNNENGLSSAAVLDGFIITSANAYGQYPEWGGGMRNYNSSPAIKNCLFENNTASCGGAIYNAGNSPLITNCYFRNNSALTGGAVCGSSYSGSFINCIFFNNSSSEWGGAIYNFYSSNTYINCTFNHNSTSNSYYGGGAIHDNQDDHPTLINCILWGNYPNQVDDVQGSSSTIKNSDIDQDGWAGQNGNIRQDPFFIDTANGNLRVLDCSLTINKGDDASNSTVTDIDGNPRKFGTIDIGAFENQNTPTTPTLITTQPQARDTVTKGGNVAITVAVSGPVVAYQWYKDGQPVNGQTTATLSFMNVQVAQAGNYTLKITGSCNTLTSSVVTLIVPSRFYVNAAVAASGDGTSWETAFKTLQEALKPSAIEVWVASGTYKPTSGTDRGASFYIPSSLKVYGSFAGSESNLAERSLNPANRSILSGDVGGNGVSEQSSEHVVVFSNVDNNTLLDGFEITHGYSYDAGGGGIYITGGNSNPIIANCLINNNSALYNGGGVYSENYIKGSNTTNNPSFINCNFSQNRSEREGGAVYIGFPSFDAYNNSNTFTNCSFTQNSAAKGGAIYAIDFGGVIKINLTNCIVWNNTGGGLVGGYGAYTYNVSSSDVDNQDPLFVDAAHGDLHLQACSPVINAGDNGANSTDKDLDGNRRIANSTIDMGAYEFQGQTGPATIINMPQPATVCAGAQAKFSVTATGAGLGYQWQKNGVDINGATDSTYTINAAGAADTGYYKVTVSGACGLPVVSDSAHLSVNIVPAPVVTVANNCGSSTLSTTATGSLLWSNGATTPSITVSNAETFSVTQTVNGCTSAAGSGTAAPKAIPSAPVVTVSNSCGSSTLSTTATGSLLWSNGATTPSITVSNAGTFSVTQTVNGCTSAAGSGTAAPKAIPSAPVVTVSNSCGSSTLSTTATGTLLWSTGATTSSIVVTTVGTYTVTQTVGGCTSLQGSGIASPKTAPAAPVVTVTNSCGSSTLSTIATGSLLWSTGETTSSINVTTAGNYTVTQTVNGCTSAAGSGTAAPKAIPLTPVIIVTNNCGYSTLSTTAAGTLLWSTGATTASITVSIAGNYTVTQTINGCTSVAGSGTAAPKAVPSAPVVTVSDNCGNSTLLTTATGTLLWSTGATALSITVTTPGSYTVTQTVNGCTSAAGSGTAAPKAIPSAPVVTVSNNCGSSTLSTIAKGNLLWNTGATTPSITISNAGNYTVTQTVNGCTSAAGSGTAAPKTSPSKPVITANGPTTFCNAGSVTLSAPLGFSSYKWSNNATTQTITVNQSGSYSVVVTNAAGCTSPASDTVRVTVSIDTQKPVITCPAAVTLCYDVTENYNITPLQATDNCGIASISYTISGATVRSGTSLNASGKFSSGTSTITWTVKDGSGNTSTCQSNVTVNEKFSVYIPDGWALGSGCTLSTVYTGYTPASYILLIAIPSGGKAPFTYKWSNGSTALFILVNPAVATTYKVTVKDAKGCTQSASKQINVVDVRCGSKMDKVTLCYKGNTLCADQKDVADYLLHGAYLGNCKGSTGASREANELALKEMAEQTDLTMKASPNPTVNFFKLTVNSSNLTDKISIYIIDESGKAVETKTAIAGETLQIGDQYRAGVYFVQALQGNKRVTLKLIKQAW